MRRVLPRLPVVLRAYAGVLITYVPLRFTGDLLPPVTVLGQFEPWLTGGALLLLPFALARRIPWVAVALGLGAALGVALHAPLVMQALRQAPSGATGPVAFTVTTWNAGLDRATPAEVCQTLARDNSDLVALQELRPEHFEAIEAAFAERFPYRDYRGKGRHAIAVLSSVPLEEAQWVEPEHGNPWLRFAIVLGGKRVDVTTLHMDARVAALSRYAPAHENLARIVAGMGPGPGVLLGDFNMSPRTGEYRRLQQRGFNDAFAAVGRGFGFTFPVFLKYRGFPVPPMVRIDQVWYRGELEPLALTTGPAGGSDHLPVRVAFGWDTAMAAGQDL